MEQVVASRASSSRMSHPGLLTGSAALRSSGLDSRWQMHPADPKEKSRIIFFPDSTPCRFPIWSNTAHNASKLSWVLLDVVDCLWFTIKQDYPRMMWDWDYGNEKKSGISVKAMPHSNQKRMFCVETKHAQCYGILKIKLFQLFPDQSNV